MPFRPIPAISATAASGTMNWANPNAIWVMPLA